LRGVLSNSSVLLCSFCGKKDSLQRTFINKYLLFFCEKCLSRKAVHNWVERRGKPFADDEEVETEVRKWLRQLSKELYAACFDAFVKRWDKCINVGVGCFMFYIYLRPIY
jgi:hypothetical protein